jgi:DNA-binding CsgD family transcriptional regulator
MLKIDFETLSDIVELLYDASMQSGLWPRFCNQLMKQVQSTDFNMQILEIASGKIIVPHGGTAVQPEFLQPYFAHYHAINPYLNHSLPKIHTGYIARSHHECHPDEFEKTEFYQDWMRKLDLFHTIHLVVLSEGGLSANIGMARPKKMGIYEEDDERLLRFLTPHLQRAFRIANFISDLSDKREVLAEALDKLPQGVIVVNRSGRVIFVNDSAERIANACDGFCIDKLGRPRAEEPKDTRLLTRLIETATRPEEDAGLNRGGAMRLARPSGLRPLSLFVAPLSRDRSEWNPGQSAALIFITDPESKMYMGQEAARRLYQLTPAEARLMALLAEGKSVTEASEELAVTVNTIRTHLKRLFQKTGARRQGDLVRLFINSPANLK